VKVCRDQFYDVSSAGKLFHISVVATGNTRSPTVDSCVGGTCNADVDNDRRSVLVTKHMGVNKLREIVAAPNTTNTNTFSI